MTRDALQIMVARTRRRLWLGRMLRGLERGLAISLLAAVPIVVVHVWLLPVPFRLSLGLAGLPILGAVLAGALARPSAERAAAELDRRLAAAELVVTAWDLARTDEAAGSPNAGLIRQRAAALCAGSGGAALAGVCRLPGSVPLLAALLAGLVIPLAQRYGAAAAEHTARASAQAAVPAAAGFFAASVPRELETWPEQPGAGANRPAGHSSAAGTALPGSTGTASAGAPAAAGANDRSLRPGTGGDAATGDTAGAAAATGGEPPADAGIAWTGMSRRPAGAAAGSLTAAAPLVATSADAAGEPAAAVEAAPARVPAGPRSLQRSFALEAWLFSTEQRDD